MDKDVFDFQNQTSNPVADIFNASPDQNLMQTATQLSRFIVVEEAACDQLEAELKERKAGVDNAKTQLAQMLIAAGMESIKIDGGLSPKAKIVRKFFKLPELEDTVVFGWLTENHLEGIIKPYVHFQTLQATLKDFESAGNEIPKTIFNITETPTVTLYGKSKYMASMMASSLKGK